MKNHFHLQVETPKPSVQEAMQRLLSGYVVRFNLRHRSEPPLELAVAILRPVIWVTELS